MTEEDYFKRGAQAIDKANWVEAIEAFSKVIVHDSNNATAYNCRGIALGRLGRYEEAIVDCDKAIELEPNNAATYTNRGVVKQELGRYQEAIVDHDKAIKLGLNDAKVYYNRGIPKQELGRNQEAIADYGKAIEIAPDYAVAYNNRGAAKKDLGQYEDAIADYDKAIELDPNYAKAYYNRGQLKSGLGKKEEALKDIRKANEIDPILIAKEQSAKQQKDALRDKQGTEEVEGFQKIFEDLWETHNGMRKWWLGVSVSMVVLTFTMLIAHTTIDIFWELDLTRWAYNFYIIYIFLTLTTGFTTRQYTNAKRLMLKEINRLAMAKLFEKIQNSDIDKNKEYHLFIPGLIQSIVYSTGKDGDAEKGGSTAIVEEILSRLKDRLP